MKLVAVATTTRAAIYVRLSKEDVRGKALGIESISIQTKDARAAIEREGWAFDEEHVFVDDGMSGTKEARPAWQRMLEAAKRGAFEVVVVRDLDRFSRLETGRTLGVLQDLADVGVTLWSYRERAPISVGGDAVIITAVKARQAKAEAEKASERITAGLRARAHEGRATGRAPFGYRVKTITEQDVRDSGGKERPGKWLVQHEPELAVVRRLAALFLQTGSLAATARVLNDEGIRPPQGARWGTATSVRSLLLQPIYRGYRTYRGERVEQPGLGIFSAEEVKRIDAALERAAKNRPWSSAKRKSSLFNLSAPFIACGICGGTVTATGSETGSRSYVCDRQRTHACRGIGYRSAARVDEALVRAVSATITPDAIAAVCALVRQELEAKPAKGQDDRGRMVREIAATEKRVNNLTEAVAEAPAGVRAALYTKLGAEQDRLAALRAGLARVDVAPPELDARRTIANVQKRAAGLRVMLEKGGPDAAAAIRTILGDTRLKAHLVTVDGKRGWKLTGRIAGFYVLDQDHHGLCTNLMARVRTMVVAAVA